MSDWQTVARQAAERHGVDPEIFIRQINQESGGRDVTSGAGAQGPAQFIPSTGRQYGLNSTTIHQLGPSLDAAARLMADNLKQYGSYQRALSAYNSGKPDAYKDPNFAGGQTYDYVKTILGGANPKVGNASSSDSSSSDTGAGTSSSSSPDFGSGQASDFTGLLAQMLGQSQRPQAVQQPLQAPAFLSQLATPQGFTPLQPAVSQPDAGQQDALSANLSLLGALQGPSGASGQGQDVSGAQAAPGSSTGGIAQKVAQQRSSGFHGSDVLELIYNDGGQGYGIKNGQIVDAPQVYSGVWAGHANHVHVAAGKKTVVQLGKLAQSMGLTVSENPSFGGVDPVHVPGSYHYKGEAIDVSGTPEQRTAFAKAVEQYNRTHRL